MSAGGPIEPPGAEPPVRSGEMLRHLASPPDARAGLLVARIVLVAGAAFAVTVGVMADFPLNLGLVAAVIAMLVVVMHLLDRPARAQLDAATDPDSLIELLVVPEGLVTHGGLDVSWREIESVHVDEREYQGKGVSVHVLVRFSTDDVRDRATSEQRMAFVPMSRTADLRLLMISRAERNRTNTVLRQQCERAGVRFSSGRRTLRAGAQTRF